MPSEKHLDVTEAELAVLKELWGARALTIRQLTDALYPAGGTSHYATVQKLLERLRDKGCVERRAEGRAHLYRATIEREALIAHRLKQTAERLAEGSLVPLLTRLVEEEEIDAEKLRSLRDLVDRLADGKERR